MTTDPLPPFRRIVTANSPDGRSRILSDGPSPHVLLVGPQRGLTELWATDGATPLLEPEDGADRPIRLEPPAGGMVFRYLQLGPRSVAGVDPEVAERAAAAAFATMGGAHLRVDTRRHPSMHRSETLDCIVLLKGTVTLILDDEETVLHPYDVVVQRATNHAWVNQSDEPALLLCLLIDAGSAPAGTGA